MSYHLDEAANGSGYKIVGVGGKQLDHHKTVYISSDGKWYESSASSESTMPITAITCGSVPANQNGEILLFGLISKNTWNWVSGELLYASTDSGELTQTIPEESGNQVQVIGRALSNKVILFMPNHILVEVE